MDRKSVRICGDFINPVSELHRYPIPKIEDCQSCTKVATVYVNYRFTDTHKQESYRKLDTDTDSDSEQNKVTVVTLSSAGVTADLFRFANLFRRNLYASVIVPVFFRNSADLFRVFCFD